MSTSPNEDGRPTQGGAAAPVHVMNPSQVTLAPGANVSVVELPDATPTGDGENPNVSRIGSLNYGYNGSTWDRIRTAISDAMAATGLLGFVTMLWNGATFDRLKGDNTGAARVSLYGKGTVAGDTAVPTTTSGAIKVNATISNTSADGFANSISYARDDSDTFRLFAQAAHSHNSASWDRLRNNHEVTALASAARTASVDSADLVNYNARGVIVVVDITALTATGTLTVTIQGKDTLSGKYYTLLASALLAATGTTVMVVYPGTTIAANLDANAPLPRIWRVSVVAGNGVSITYSIGCNFVL